MGTNYYAVSPRGKVHLGKSSAGWQFLCKADPEWKKEDCLDLWLSRVISAKRIVNEYNEPVTIAEILEIVFNKLSDSDCISHTEYLRNNYPSYTANGTDFDCKGVNFSTVEFS